MEVEQEEVEVEQEEVEQEEVEEVGVEQEEVEGGLNLLILIRGWELKQECIDC